jgi:FkbM family methyltransferase
MEDHDFDNEDAGLSAEERAEHERLRGVWFDEARNYTEYLWTRVDDAPPTRMFVKTEDKHIGRTLFSKQGRGDIKVIRRCAAVVRGLLGDDAIVGRTLLDVGANIGTTSIPTMLTIPFKDAVAIEPEPENYMTLRLNIVLNGLDTRMKALQVAASDVVGELSLMVNRSRSGKHWIASDDSLAADAGPDAVATTVPVVTLDSLAGDAYDPDRVGFVWMDAENHEGQILRGASELLKRGVPVTFEWDREGLHERGSLDSIVAAAQSNYTHFADMRATRQKDKPKYQLRPISELGNYGHITVDGSEHFTEIIILRLEGDVSDVDLVALARGKFDDGS